MRLDKILYGTLKAVVDLRGYPYDGWRASYLHTTGIIMIMRAEQHDGSCVFFLPYEKGCPVQRHMHTSLGQVQKNDDEFVIHTKNSIYVFTVDENCLFSEEKFVLCVYAGKLMGI